MGNELPGSWGSCSAGKTTDRSTPDTVTEHFNRIVDRANLPAIELHAVRHTYATTALRAGINPKLVSALMGHSLVALTLDRYTDSIPELDRTAAEQVSRLFFTLPDPTTNNSDRK